MSDHTEPVEEAKRAAEREVADLEERGERLEAHIEETRKDWEAKQQDDGVPGATGEPDRAEADEDQD